ncbi:MAG TPA: hypothetical protein VM053_11630 [Gemmatimonadaceae bacterium]|nr:hypothetical protein [Gemmatimonadaceae bacterium]
MTEDERIDDNIIAAARDYNRAPVTPSEDMWAAIQAGRTAQAAGPRLHVASGGAAGGPAYDPKRRFGSRYTWLGLAAAAALLIATGVGIGRWTSRPVSGPSVAAVTRPAVDAPNNTATLPEGQSPSNIEQAPGTVASEAPMATPAAGQKRTRNEIRNSPRIIGTGRGLQLASGSQNNSYGSSAIAPSAVSYQVATQRHLEDAEALLTSYSLEGRDSKMDAQFAGWAKGLLSSTRLLLDSPAGDDPRRARLLQDLELILAQIVQLSPNAAATDRELVQGSIQNGHVMTRLRSAIPAGQPRGILEK